MSEKGLSRLCENSAVDDFDEPIRIPVTDVFDLHSVPPADARGVVEAYLEEAYRLGLTALRIIHGRGIGVQRAMVRAVLEATPFVDSFCDAPAEAGGWGATIVTLKPGITLKPGGTGSESGQSGRRSPRSG